MKQITIEKLMMNDEHVVCSAKVILPPNKVVMIIYLIVGILLIFFSTGSYFLFGFGCVMICLAIIMLIINPVLQKNQTIYLTNRRLIAIRKGHIQELCLNQCAIDMTYKDEQKGELVVFSNGKKFKYRLLTNALEFKKLLTEYMGRK